MAMPGLTFEKIVGPTKLPLSKPGTRGLRPSSSSVAPSPIPPSITPSTPPSHARAGGAGDRRAQVGAALGAGAEPQRPGLGHQFRNPLLRSAHQQHHGQGHAALAG